MPKGRDGFIQQSFITKKHKHMQQQNKEEPCLTSMRVGSPLSPQLCRGSQLAEEPQREVVCRAVRGGRSLASTVHYEHLPLPPW